MHQFRNDYSEGAAPAILDALVRTNAEQCPGYGEDAHCARAAELIRAEVGQPDAHVSFVPGGTPANILAITALTEEFEGPLCAADAHPTIHETGAIEAHGRRLLATHDPLGRLTPEGIRAGLAGKKREKLLKRKLANLKKARELLSVTVPRVEAEAIFAESGSEMPESGITYGGLMRRPEISAASVRAHASALSFLSPSEAEELLTDVRYEGYLARQEKARAEAIRLENMPVPRDTDYSAMHGLRLEAIEKLQRVRPVTVGQASRIPGVTPADVNVLIIKLKALSAKK